MVPKETIQKMTDRIVERFSPTKVILFGSHARGDATRDSDLDFLVVMPFTGSRVKLAIEIRKLLFGFGVSKDVMVVTPEEFETYKQYPGSVAYSAAREGRVLYAA